MGSKRACPKSLWLCDEGGGGVVSIHALKQYSEVNLTVKGSIPQKFMPVFRIEFSFIFLLFNSTTTQLATAHAVINKTRHQTNRRFNYFPVLQKSTWHQIPHLVAKLNDAWERIQAESLFPKQSKNKEATKIHIERRAENGFKDNTDKINLASMIVFDVSSRRLSVKKSTWPQQWVLFFACVELTTKRSFQFQQIMFRNVQKPPKHRFKCWMG